MGVPEEVVKGVFGLARDLLLVTFLVIAAWFYLDVIKGGSWGSVRQGLSPFSPRRLWCRHRVAAYGRGRNGLWTWWCTACGKRVGSAGGSGR